MNRIVQAWLAEKRINTPRGVVFQIFSSSAIGFQVPGSGPAPLVQA
jgi:hypothetical protein